MDEFLKIRFELFRKRAAPVAEPSRAYLLDGFTPEEVSALLRVRTAFTQGEYSENTHEFKQLMFARWLVEHGRLGG